MVRSKQDKRRLEFPQFEYLEFHLCPDNTPFEEGYRAKVYIINLQTCKPNQIKREEKQSAPIREQRVLWKQIENGDEQKQRQRIGEDESVNWRRRRRRKIG